MGAGAGRGRSGAGRGDGRRAGPADLHRGRGRPAGRRIPRQRIDIHPRPVRRPRGPDADRGGQAGNSRRRGRCPPPHPVRGTTGHRQSLVHRGDRRPALRTGVLHAQRHRHTARSRLRGALQLRSHRCAIDRAEAGMGPPRRRRGRTAPVEHPRQRLLGGLARLHRGHPDPARSGWSEPRWFRLPGHRHRRRPLETGPARPRRHHPVRAGACLGGTRTGHRGPGSASLHPGGVLSRRRRG